MNIKLIAYCGVGILILFLGWYARSVVSERDALKIEVDSLDDHLEAVSLEIKKCNEQKVLAENVAKNRLEKNRDLNKQLVADKLLRDPRNAKCVPITE